MKSSYLKGNILCALPQLKDGFFSKSIIYLTHHNKDGAVGIVLNYKIMNIKGCELFKKLNMSHINENLDMEFPFHIGGPLNQNNGFILHSNDYKSENTLKVSKNVKLTCSTEIICDIATNKGPKKFFISLGYSGWGPGQLENELKQNSWINIKEELDLLFEVESEKRWRNAIKKTGIDFTKFSTSSGTA
jgi:putative transcriptional regulator